MSAKENNLTPWGQEVPEAQRPYDAGRVGEVPDGERRRRRHHGQRVAGQRQFSRLGV